MRYSQREKSRSGWVLVALVAASFLLTTLYHREGESGPLRMLRSAFISVTTPAAQVGAWITAPVRATSSWLDGVAVSREEVGMLREQNAQLRQLVAELEEARLENERLRGLVGFVDARDLEVRGARIVARPATTWETLLTIDRGSEDGIRVGMPVLTAHGLLGTVVEVASGSSRVRPLTDPRSGAAAMLQSSRAEGVASGSADGTLYMEFVSRDVTVTVGEAVLTSGLGGVYPRGLLIGEVAAYRLGNADLHPTIEVRASVSLSAVEEVLVLVGVPDGEGGGLE